MDQDEEYVTIYSDYVCPFCYLGRESLQAYQTSRTESLDIDWQPFDLRSHKRGPDGEIDDSVEDDKDEAYFEQVSQNVSRLKERYGAQEMLDLNELPENVDSLNAQVASYYVKQEYPQQWLAFDEAIFEALWVDGRDIGNVDVLAELADDNGLDGDEILTAIYDEELREQLHARFTEAHQQGITGVPTFIYGERAARGAVPPEQLEQLIEEP